MPREIVMPQLSETMSEGDLVAWLVPEGAKLRAGEPIAEIETDKATVELEAPADGTLERILVRAGTQAVAVGQVLAILRGIDDGEGISPSTSVAPPQEQAVEPARSDGQRRASPLARRMAAQKGLDLDAIAGTGGDGRVLRADVERTLGRATQSSSSAPFRPALPPATALAAGSYREERLSRARRTIADRLSAAKRDIPHFYLHVECEIGAAVELREQLNRRSQERRLSLNDFVVRAAALALSEVPAANASFLEGVLRLHSEADVAIAVASDAGLITPIIRSAGRKSLAQISDEARELIARARDGRLAAEEYQGGTFTVSNLGMFGVDGLYAIVNPPQVAILGVGRVHARPIARAGAVVVEPMTRLSLSADHRVVDGATGAQLLGAIRAHLEDPLSLLV